VARGFEQKFGIDYNETFAPVIYWSTLRAMVALSVFLGWELNHMDVITAFLNGKLKEEIYMKQPPGFEVPGQEDKVCRLLRSLYGLKQSPRQWYEEIDGYLRSTGWTRSQLDPNLYFLKQGKTLTILLLYVDDLLIFGSDKGTVVNIKAQLGSQYKMKDLGLVNHYLGVDFIRTSDGKVFLHQQQYTKDLLRDCKVPPNAIEFIPLPVGHILEDDTKTPFVDLSAYCHIVGKLIFLCHTRPNISYAVGIVSQHMHAPQEAHWDSLQHILRYLNYTSDFGILYDKDTASPLQGYSDSNYLSCKNTWRSVGSYLFKFANFVGQ
jgi:hypothetical protein